MYLMSVSISNKSISVDIKKSRKRYFLLREIDSLILTRIDLSINTISIIIHLIEINKR